MTKRAIDEAVAKQFGEKIRTLREQKGWQQNELAERAGCSKARLSMIEAGKHFPLWPMVKKLASALGVSTDELPG